MFEWFYTIFMKWVGPPRIQSDFVQIPDGLSLVTKLEDFSTTWTARLLSRKFKIIKDDKNLLGDGVYGKVYSVNQNCAIKEYTSVDISTDIAGLTLYTSLELCYTTGMNSQATTKRLTSGYHNDAIVEYLLSNYLSATLSDKTMCFFPISPPLIIKGSDDKRHVVSFMQRYETSVFNFSRALDIDDFSKYVPTLRYCFFAVCHAMILAENLGVHHLDLSTRNVLLETFSSENDYDLELDFGDGCVMAFPSKDIYFIPKITDWGLSVRKHAPVIQDIDRIHYDRISSTSPLVDESWVDIVKWCYSVSIIDVSGIYLDDVHDILFEYLFENSVSSHQEIRKIIFSDVNGIPQYNSKLKDKTFKRLVQFALR
jgi:hypothetical protein